MKFTDKFIKIPVVVVLKSEQDMGIEGEESAVMLNILPWSIESYRSSFSTSDEDGTNCILVTKSGEEYVVPMFLQELENLLNSYDNDHAS